MRLELSALERDILTVGHGKLFVLLASIAIAITSCSCIAGNVNSGTVLLSPCKYAHTHPGRGM